MNSSTSFNMPKRFGEQADAFLKLYPAHEPSTSGLAQKQSARDQGLVSMYLWAVNRAKTSKTPAYTYYFTRGIPWPEHPEYGAFHSGDFPYFFANLKQLNRPWEAVGHKLADTVSSYWVNFARTGNPNGKGLPNWPAFDAAAQVTMELGEKIAARPVAEAEDSQILVEAVKAGKLTDTASRLWKGRKTQISRLSAPPRRSSGCIRITFSAR